MTCLTHVLSTRSIYQYAVQDDMCIGANMCIHVPFHSNLMLWVQDIFHDEYEMNMQGSLSDVDLFSHFLSTQQSVWKFDVDGEVSNKPPRSWSTWMVNYLPHCRSPSCHPSTERRGSQPTNNRWLNFLTYLVGC